MGYGGVILDSRGDVTVKVGIMMSKLVCKGGEDVFEFPSVKVIPGAEEAGTKQSLFGNCF